MIWCCKIFNIFITVSTGTSETINPPHELIDSTLKHGILCLLQKPLSQFGACEVENVKILLTDRQTYKWKTGNKKH